MGIASNLIKKCIEIANHINCSHIVTCATAVGSQNLFRKVPKIQFFNIFISKDWLRNCSQDFIRRFLGGRSTSF